MATSEASTRVPETGRSGWTIETAIDHLLSVVNEKHAQTMTVIAGNDKRYEERFAASQKALELGLMGTKSEISLALQAADRAVQKAEVATEKRFESVNEFRGTLDSQQRTLIPRSEVSVLVDGLNEKIASLTKVVDEQKAMLAKLQAERQGVVGGWGYAVGAVGLLLAIGSLAMIGIKFVQATP